VSDLTTRRGHSIKHCHCTQEGLIIDATERRMVGLCQEPLLTHNIKISLSEQIEKTYPGLRRVGLPTHEFNCHGKTFGKKECLIDNVEVPKILEDNGYNLVVGPTQAGDLIVYRDRNGAVAHTGFVHEVDAEGKIILVQSKWGRLGDYLHPMDKVPPEYGTWFVFRLIES